MSSKTKLRTNPAKKKTKYRDESPLLYFLCSIIWREYCIHYAFFIFIFMPPWWVLRLSSPRSLPAMTFAPGRGWSACGNYELEPISSLPEQNKKIISLIISGLITLDFRNCSQILLFILLGYWLLGMIWKSNKFTCIKGNNYAFCYKQQQYSPGAPLKPRLYLLLLMWKQYFVNKMHFPLYKRH